MGKSRCKKDVYTCISNTCSGTTLNNGKSWPHSRGKKVISTLYTGGTVVSSPWVYCIRCPLGITGFIRNKLTFSEKRHHPSFSKISFFPFFPLFCGGWVWGWGAVHTLHTQTAALKARLSMVVIILFEALVMP